MSPASSSSMATVDVPGAANGTYATAINDAGDIAGYYTDDQHHDHGFVCSDGAITPFNDPAGANGTRPTGINAARTVVGTYLDKQRVTHGFACRDGVFSSLDAPDGVNGTYPSAINSSGQIVGWFVDKAFHVHAFLYANGRFTTLAPRGMDAGSWANGINDPGVIVGAGSFGDRHVIYGFSLAGNQTTVLHGPKGALSVEATGINNAGQIVGDCITDAMEGATFLREKGEYTPIEPTRGASTACGINNRSQIVGTYHPGHGGRIAGFIWCPSGSPVHGGFAVAHFPAVGSSSGPKPILVLREGLDGAIGEWSSPAKFALYDDGTVIYDSCDELSQYVGEPQYYTEKLSRIDMANFIGSVGAGVVIGNGESQFGRGEDKTWKIFYWSRSGVRQSATVIGSLSDAPDNLVKVINSLDQYPQPIKKYQRFEYQVVFAPTDDSAGIDWPASWGNVTFPNSMLVDWWLPDSTQSCRVDPQQADELLRMLRKANTREVKLAGHSWTLSHISADVHLPNERIWIHSSQ